MVQEYESDDLASDSKDEKKLRKAKRAMGGKEKKLKASVVMRWKNLSPVVILSFSAVRSLTVLLCEVSRWLDCLSSQPSGCCGYVFPELKGKVIYVRLSVAS